MNMIIETDTELLQKDTGRIQVQYDVVKKTVKQITDELLELNLSWEGPAKAAFVDQFSNDLQFVGEVLQGLEDIIDTMTKAREEYDRCEAEVRSIIDSL